MSAVLVEDLATATGILDGLACTRGGCACHTSRKRGSGMTHCPSHNDPDPDLNVTVVNGRVLVHCHAHCKQENVIAVLRERGLWPETKPVQAPVAYDYRNAAGKLIYQVVRKPDKKFSQRRPDGNGGWAWNLNATERVLYRLPELIANKDRAVFVTEGEKDADRIASLGLVATTNNGGAGKWLTEFAESLRDRTVYVLPDNDQPGRDHAQAVAASLHGVAREIRIVELPGLPDKGDVSDWLGRGGTAEQLKTLVRQTPVWTARAETQIRNARLGTLAADVEIQPIDWLWRYRLPVGMLGILDGNPGDGKSTLVASLASHLTTGTPWPDGSPCRKCSVIIVGVEDSYAHTVKPRLMAAGADMSRVSLVGLIDDGNGGKRMPSLPDDIPLFEREIRESDAGLIVFDPIMGYLAEALSSNSAKDVTRALSPLAEMLDKTHCTGMMLRHYAKDDKTSFAIFRGLGSIAFISISRFAMAVSQDKDNEGDLVLMVTKATNGPKLKARRYRIESVNLPSPLGTVETSRILWGDESEHQPDVVLTAFGGDRKKKEFGRELMDQLLEAGPMDSVKVIKAFEEQGLSESTAWRIKKERGVKARKKDFDAGWEWYFVEASRRVSKPDQSSSKTRRPSDSLFDTLRESLRENDSLGSPEGIHLRVFAREAPAGPDQPYEICPTCELLMIPTEDGVVCPRCPTTPSAIAISE